MTTVLWSRQAAAAADDRPMPRALTIDDAVAAALHQNLDLKTRELERDIAQGVLLQTTAYPNPELDVAVETDRMFADQGEGRRSIGLSQTIITAGKRRQRQENARFGVTVAEDTINDAKRRLISEVEETFYRLLFTQERLALAKGQVDLAERVVALSGGRFREGFAPEMDVTLAKVEYHTRLQEVVGLDQEVIETRADLNTLMGRPGGDPVVAQGPLVAPRRFENDGEFSAVAVAQRPDLRALTTDAQRAAGELELVRAERMPDVTLSLDVSEERTVFDAPGLTDRDRLVGVKVSVPIPLFDRKPGELASAQARLRQVEAERAALAARIARDVHVTSARIASAEQRLAHFGRDVVPLATSNLDLTRQAYEQGFAGIIQLLEAQRRFADMQLGELTAQYEHRLAVVALEREIAARVAGSSSGSLPIGGEKP
ncbi:MAG: TolC family protein [Nitrospirota bacterium]